MDKQQQSFTDGRSQTDDTYLRSQTDDTYLRSQADDTYLRSQTDDTYLRDTSTTVTSIGNYPLSQATKQENRPPKSLILSPVSPGTEGNLSSNNITCLLDPYFDISQSQTIETTLTPLTPCRLPFMSQRQKILPIPSTSGNGDVENDGQELLRTSEALTLTDSSMSTQGSTSPRSTATTSSPVESSNSSPGSTAESTASPHVIEEPPKKKIRTTYTNCQVQALQTFFFENPYPDSEMMEHIGKELSIPENKVKIWFQNKRARWRRGANDNSNPFPQPYLQMSPMMQQVRSYGLVPPNHMMASPLPQSVPRYFNNQWIQRSPSTLRNHSNQSRSRLQSTNQPALSPQLVSHSVPPIADMSGAFPYPTPSLRQMMISQQHQPLHNPPFSYKPSYESSEQNQ